MSKSSEERLYNLLPAIYRRRDVGQGQPLRAFMAVLESELDRLEADIDNLHDDWFIETCAEWVVPYIGDLLGVRPLHSVDSAGIYSQRAYVANSLRYRRRKGTVPVLEQLARDVTGWPARAVEFFQRLRTNQHLNHVRLDNVSTPDLHHANQLELLGGPFEQVAHTAEIRRIATGRGQYNIPNIGLFLWRLQSYYISRSTARAVSDPPDGRYTFNPLGLDAPLFNRPRTETEVTHLAEEINVPGALRRRALYDDLEAYRTVLAQGQAEPKMNYFGQQPVLEVYLDGAAEPLSPEELLVCHLDVWDTAGWQLPAGDAGQKVAVDPELGRLSLLQGALPEPNELLVSYAYGFSGDVGGGPYYRGEAISAGLNREITWQKGVSQAAPPQPEKIYNTLSDAIQAWNAQPPGTVGVIAILDSHTYEEDLIGSQKIIVPDGSQLAIVAANWHEADAPNFGGSTQSSLGRLSLDSLRPHLRGNISVFGDASANPGELVLDGLLIEGSLRVLIGNLGGLRVSHCTVVPDRGKLSVNPSTAPESQNDQLSVTIIRSITGPISLAESVPNLRLDDSTVDATGGAAIAAPGSRARITACTIIGTSKVGSVEASEAIFTEPIGVERRQVGCVRYSYVPAGSRTPRLYRCQPDLALQDVADSARQTNIRTRLTPSFTSGQYGQPGYAQLSRNCAPEIRTGAEDGSEMGVFSHLKQPQREANLRAALDEYLRFGLEAGLFYIT